MAEVQHLKLQVHSLRSRNAELDTELEKQVKESSALSLSTLASQMDGMVSAQYSAYHGPDTTANFNDFSIDHLTTEFKVHAPDVWLLLNILGNTDRFSENDEQRALAEGRAASSMCAILKCRRLKTLGIQLLISLVLIARATNRRVHICVYKN